MAETGSVRPVFEHGPHHAREVRSVKLNALQRSWMIAAAIFFVAVGLDVANFINVPRSVLIIGPILLFLVSWVAGPSLKELSKAHRRG
jgi:hypothetical protein